MAMLGRLLASAGGAVVDGATYLGPVPGHDIM